MERQPPTTTSDAIDLYLRTIYSLLRSSGEVRVRAFEEAHAYSGSSLHAGALDERPDVSAFGYSAARMPLCLIDVTKVVIGQSHEHFESAGMPVREWERVRSRGRRRPMRWAGGDTLACFATSTSDIDDVVPILTCWQIEWNKMHGSLASTAVGAAIAAGGPLEPPGLAEALSLDAHGLDMLRAAFGDAWDRGLRALASRECDLYVRLLAGAHSGYQRASQRWWSGIEPTYVREEEPRRRPVYFVSSNTHSFPNLLSGWAARNQGRICDWARARNHEGLGSTVDKALGRGDHAEIANLTYYLSRAFLREGDGDYAARLADLQCMDAESGVHTISTPGHVDVDAQIVELGKLHPERIDPRLRVPGVEKLVHSQAVVINIDYPLGMAAYHHLSRLGQGVGEVRGLYVMGKAATLNGRVGDVMLSGVVHDEHTTNTYLFRNCFTAAHVQPYLHYGSVFDNQKALTVRGPFLQNQEYMGVFYREGFSVLEMEAGPYLSAIYELVYPNRHPLDELIHLSNLTPFDVGILHYASDTPYSRRQNLLSKSLSYFGVDATYACAIAILREILTREVGLAG